MTEAFPADPKTPGSLKDFVITRGFEPGNSQATHEYTAALAQYRAELAKARGISLEELHEGPLRSAGRIARKAAEAEASTADAT